MSTRLRKYNPEWLVQLAISQHPDKPWLADALAACQTSVSRNRVKLHFVDSTNANKPGADWQWAGHIWLRDPIVGNVLLDILTGQRVGGLEYYDRLFKKR